MEDRSEVYDAEMTALAWAAQNVDTYIREKENASIRHLRFFADNTAAISVIFEAKMGPSQGDSRIFREIVTRFLEADPNHTVNIEWTPGHKGIIENEIADQLAKDTIELDAGNARATRSNALQRAKERSLQAWVREWKETRPTGRFATANKLPPKNEPRKQFKILPRELFG